MSGTITSPSLTGSVPPGTKQFWTSMTRSTSVADGLSFPPVAWRTPAPAWGPTSARIRAAAASWGTWRRPRVSWNEDPLSGRLGVEEPVGLLRLLEREAVGEQPLERDLALGDEAGAFFLTHRAERPRGVDRELLPDHVLADVERRRVALSDEAD